MNRMEQIRQSIWEKLCNRFAAEAIGTKVDAEQFDRVLALWIDLRRAIHLFGESECLEPWSGPHKEIQEAWTVFTAPGNDIALEQLLGQVPDASHAALVKRALETARERKTLGTAQPCLSSQKQLSSTPTLYNVSQT